MFLRDRSADSPARSVPSFVCVPLRPFLRRNGVPQRNKIRRVSLSLSRSILPSPPPPWFSCSAMQSEGREKKGRRDRRRTRLIKCCQSTRAGPSAIFSFAATVVSPRRIPIFFITKRVCDEKERERGVVYIRIRRRP